MRQGNSAVPVLGLEISKNQTLKILIQWSKRSLFMQLQHNNTHFYCNIITMQLHTLY